MVFRWFEKSSIQKMHSDDSYFLSLLQLIQILLLKGWSIKAGMSRTNNKKLPKIVRIKKTFFHSLSNIRMLSIHSRNIEKKT